MSSTPPKMGKTIRAALPPDPVSVVVSFFAVSPNMLVCSVSKPQVSSYKFRYCIIANTSIRRNAVKAIPVAWAGLAEDMVSPTASRSGL